MFASGHDAVHRVFCKISSGVANARVCHRSEFGSLARAWASGCEHFFIRHFSRGVSSCATKSFFDAICVKRCSAKNHAARWFKALAKFPFAILASAMLSQTTKYVQAQAAETWLAIVGPAHDLSTSQPLSAINTCVPMWQYPDFVPVPSTYLLRQINTCYLCSTTDRTSTSAPFQIFVCESHFINAKITAQFIQRTKRTERFTFVSSLDFTVGSAEFVWVCFIWQRI